MIDFEILFNKVDFIFLVFNSNTEDISFHKQYCEYIRSKIIKYNPDFLSNNDEENASKSINYLDQSIEKNENNKSYNFLNEVHRTNGFHQKKALSTKNENYKNHFPKIVSIFTHLDEIEESSQEQINNIQKESQSEKLVDGLYQISNMQTKHVQEIFRKATHSTLIRKNLYGL